MANFNIKKGFNVKLAGKPELELETYENQSLFSVYPSEFEGIKIRLKVAEGDQVKRGDVLFENKQNEKMRFRSPCCGIVKAIKLGERRAPAEIEIEAAKTEESVTFDKVDPKAIDRETLVNHLLNTGLWPLIKQRPFSKIADPNATPKDVFVNAMNTGPFQVDFSIVVQGSEDEFLTGLGALEKLTEGSVHVCAADGFSIGARQSEIKNFHTFSGPHPAGNTSVHINRIAPIQPHDTVYTLRAQDVILIGSMLKTGELPRTKIVAIGGPGVKPEARKHYRVNIAASLKPLLEKILEAKPVRILDGTVLTGRILARDAAPPFYGSEITVIEEDSERHFMGWTMPGLKQYTAYRLNLSSWLAKSKTWNLGTNLHGGHRAMVVTGWFDKYQPLNIMTDYLVRAVLAHDTEEAVQLGILETDPEDFALAAFADPSKNDLCGIIKQGLEEIEKEGL